MFLLKKRIPIIGNKKPVIMAFFDTVNKSAPHETNKLSLTRRRIILPNGTFWHSNNVKKVIPIAKNCPAFCGSWKKPAQRVSPLNAFRFFLEPDKLIPVKNSKKIAREMSIKAIPRYLTISLTAFFSDK